jgi:7-cyano-7-deazaguanine synthase
MAILRIIKRAGVRLIETALPFLKTARDVLPELDSETLLTNVPDGFIPMRNLLFYGTAYYYANLYGCKYIFGGHLLSDSLGFPDASSIFFQGLEDLVYQSQLSGQTERIEIFRPFAEMTKAQVIQLGTELEVPFELTWSCYNHETFPCGECQACWERAKAFAEVGIPDPLITQRETEP